MYAVIATSGKQYKVAENVIVKIEKLKAQVGDKVEFDKVLMIASGEKINVGAPYLPNTKVVGEVVAFGRADKVHILKFRRRKHYMKRAGHRQDFTAVKIITIPAS